MKTYKLNTTQKLPISIDEAWDFFSSPLNLKEITPKEMGFDITSAHNPNEKAYAGQIITYLLTPLLGIPIKWMTEITHVKDNDYFVDEQRFGPYALWHHTHKFKEIPGGIEMFDTVHYALPYGVIGQLLHAILVKKKLEKIFEYRFEVLKNKFGEYKSY